MRTVVVAKYVPWPPNSGDKRRTLGVVRALKTRGDVILCAFSGPDEDPTPLIAEGIHIRSVPLRRRIRDLAAGVGRSRSLTAARFWDPHLAAEVDRAVDEGADVVVVEHVQLLPYLRSKYSTVSVLDMHNIESSLTARFAKSQSGVRRLILWAEAKALSKLERRAYRADVVAVVSDLDRTLLESVMTHPQVVVLPNAWDEFELLEAATEPVVSFVALLSWAPNIDAAEWFCREVWPLVLASVPAARLQLVGRNPSAAVRGLAGPSIIVTGTVPDLTPWYAWTRVAVAPLRAGGGSRLKILEALAAGRPVVSSSVGAEGLEDLIGRGVTIADEPEAMARAIVSLLSDPARSAREGLDGFDAVKTAHTWKAATAPLLTVLDDQLDR